LLLVTDFVPIADLDFTLSNFFLPSASDYCYSFPNKMTLLVLLWPTVSAAIPYFTINSNICYFSFSSKAFGLRFPEEGCCSIIKECSCIIAASS